MKRKLSLFLTVIMILSVVTMGMLSIVAYAEDSIDGYEENIHPAASTTSVGFLYSVNDDGTTCTIIDIGTCSDTNLVIPDDIDGYVVTGIGERAFADCDNLINVTISNSVTSIADSAFSSCSSLNSIMIPNSVTSIGDYAFWCCSGLESITIPDGVTIIGNYVFDYCSSLRSITIPNGVTSIGSCAFIGCSSLAGITIPNSVTSIGDQAFQDCTSLTNITIPNSVTSIGNYAFYGCSGLESITIPNSVTSIGDSSFRDCRALKIVRILDIAAWCAIEFPNSYANPLYYAKNLYLNNSLLTTITLPDDVTSIGSYAFYGCSSLTSITIPENVERIGDSAFYNCINLKNISFDQNVKLTSIDGYAFYGCSNLRSITIPDSVTSIGIGAFYYCDSLTDITIPFVGVDGTGSTSLTSVFESDPLKSIVVTGGESIDAGAFAYCSNLESITLPYIGASASASGYMSHFGYIFGYSQSQSSSGGYHFKDNNYTLCYFNYDIPESLKNVTITGGTSIGDYVFRNCTSLTNITIPDSVRTIGNGAFEGCTELTAINIPDLVQSINSGTFAGCSNLIQKENGLSYVNNWLVGCDTSRTDVSIRNDTVAIAEDAFYKCDKLKNVTVPDSVKYIGYGAFTDCTSLESIVLPFVGASDSATGYMGYFSHIFTVGASSPAAWVPESLKTVVITGGRKIPEYAFKGCINITSITLPDSLTQIGRQAFYMCTELANITILSKDVGIYSGSDTIPSQATIHGYADSTAEKYAAEYNRRFVKLSCLQHSFTKEDTTYLKSEATCSSPAVYYKRCEVCGEKGTETFEYGTTVGHSYTRKVVTDTYEKSAATCTNPAAYYYCCATCDKAGTTTFEYGTLKSHSYTRKIVTDTYKKSAATCTNPAAYYYCCATCTAKGTTTYTNGSANGHSYIEKVESAYLKSGATCTSKAVYYKSCSACGVKGTETFEAGDTASHNYQTAWSYDATSHWHECSVCGNKKNEAEHIPEEDATESTDPICAVCGYEIKESHLHAEGEWIVDKEATCAEEGSKHQVCSACGETIKIEAISKKDHEYVPVVTKPTCTERGYTTHTCSCGDGYVDTYIDALGHAEGEWIVDKEATSTEEGSKHQVCSVCGETIKTESIPITTQIASGVCGTSLTWMLSADGELVISGMGVMTDWSSYSSPWYYYRSQIKRVTIESGVMNIGNNAFYDYCNLTSVIIFDSVTSIGNYAFAACDNLTSVIIPDSVTSIGDYVFASCDKLTNVIIPDSVTSIGEYAFYNCDSLTSVIIPDSVTSIGNYAFYRCDGLTNATISSGVKSIGDYAFSDCSNLKDVYFGGTKAQWSAISKSSNWSNGIENLTIHYVGMNAGDMNGDGEFTYLDISKLYAAYRGVSEVASGVDTDVNGDGTFSYLDVSKLYAIYRGLADF